MKEHDRCNVLGHGMNVFMVILAFSHRTVRRQLVWVLQPCLGLTRRFGLPQHAHYPSMRTQAF